MELMNIHEVAERLAISVGCIRAWRLRGEGPPGYSCRKCVALGYA